MLRTLALSGAAILAATAPSALPVQWAVEDGGNGHWYEFVLDWSLDHEAAQSAAAETVFNGVSGHLVTITSPEELAFVSGLTNRSFQIGGGRNEEGEWVWLDGPEAGQRVDDFAFDGWATGHPEWSEWAEYLLLPHWADGWLGTNGYNAPYMIEFGDIPSTPLPATGLLLAAPLGAGLWVARRRRRSVRA